MAGTRSTRDTRSVVLLQAIRAKLVEYHEALVRQLVDEREAVRAAGLAQVPERAKDVRKHGVTETKEESVLADVRATKTVTHKHVDTVQGLVPTGWSPAASCASIDMPAPVMNEKTREDTVLKKRQLAEAQMTEVVWVEVDQASVKKAKSSEEKHQQFNGKSDRREACSTSAIVDKRNGAAVEHQEGLTQNAVHCVARTSAPPSKYVMQKRREEEALDNRAGHDQQQPVSLASPPASDEDARPKRSVSTPRSALVSADVNIKFEQTLRESVRLRQEVNKRSLSVTRKRQLPQLLTPARCKTHWDCLLEEMKWMATDFTQERNWKRVLQYRIATDVIVARNLGSVRQELANRQTARSVALQISAFWRTMERIAARSRVRLEAAGDRSTRANFYDTGGGGHAAQYGDHSRRDSLEDVVMVNAGEGTLPLKYHTIDIAPSSKIDAKSDGKEAGVKADTVLATAKAHVNYIVSAGKRARSAMTSLSTGCANADRSTARSLREAAFRDLQARCTASPAKGGPTIILAAFQLLALRWMLDLYSSGLNIFLNDQLGMGKAATIVAFFSLIEIVSSHKYEQQNESGSVRSRTPGRARAKKAKGPHLIVVSDEELHKWRHYLRIWHPDRRVQLYDGAGQTLHYRKRLQREWETKLRVQAHTGEDDFLVALLNDDDGEELDDDECAEPVYCVLCPVNAFNEDRQAFVAFPYWQMVVVENEHGGSFDDPVCVSALQQLRQQQRRVLCNGQSIENWRSLALRLQYAEFLVREAPAFGDSNVRKSHQHRIESWPEQDIQVERSSVAAVMEAYSKSASVRGALLKASSQTNDTARHVNALLLAMSCLSLRRVRSEVEPELRKIEEISLSCQLSQSQSTQYRSELARFMATLDAAGGREQRLRVWLQLLLRLRRICNCVDLVNDTDKLGHADLRLLADCSAKLKTLEPLLRRLTLQEGKKVVIYCQFHGMFPVLELLLSLLNIGCVRITGSLAMQRRALYHFANRRVVRVALASTRLSTSNGILAAPVYGSEAIVVVDGDWNATCDAKLRASWAKIAACGAETLPVYRLHCENTVETSLLSVGAFLTEKVFSKMSPLALLAVPSDMASMIEKPSWWSLTSSSTNGLTATGAIVDLASVAQEVEMNEKYCGGPSELEVPLVVHNVDLHAEEHLLLANTDELNPVEWYAVDYVHSITDKNPQRGDERRAERVAERIEEESGPSWNTRDKLSQLGERSFENLAVFEANRQWREGDAAAQLFHSVKSLSGTVDNSALEDLFMQMRMQGTETCFDVYMPPQVPRLSLARLQPGAFATSIDTRMTFRVSYLVPAPVPPVPHVGKSKFDHIVGQHGDVSRFNKLSKKQRVSIAVVAGARASVLGPVPGSNLTDLPSNSAGVKRKLESQLGGMKAGLQKERRVDLEGIPVSDVSEFPDDDFWGDTNLDALDSAEWDDPALFSGILGAGVGALETTVSSIASSSGTSSSGACASSASTASGMVGGGTGAHVDSGFKTGSQKSLKKLKVGTGRARKSSMSFPESGRDVWSVQDDIILKKLFELYGANWTLIAQVFNSTTAVSRFVCNKRSPRQCYDRYGKIISCGFAAVASGASAGATAAITNEDKPNVSFKVHRGASLAAAGLDTRIGLAHNELLAKFPRRYSLPGLPPPSIAGAPSQKGLTLAYRQRQVAADGDVGKKAIYTSAGGLEDLRSIKASFDAIIQCVKRKTSPPPIPIPAETTSATSASTAAPPALGSADLGTKASLTAASFSSSQALTPASAPSTPAKVSAKALKKASVSPVAAIKSNPVAMPPPHKSHTDMISLLPGTLLDPDEVIKRSKEAAVVAIQAAAVVASAGRDGSPLSASGDVMLGAGSVFGVTVSTSMPRRLHAASLTSEANAVSVMSTSTMPSTGAAAAGATATTAPAGTQAQTISAATTAAWGGLVHGVGANEANASVAVDIATISSGSDAQRTAPMPVTTSTLLHVLDRMPEVKNKIQLILNRTDCSESQKVAMIARLLSNTNAINTTNALGAPATMPLADVSSASGTAMLSALTAGFSSPNIPIDTETPIPMPAQLGPSAANLDTSSILPRQGRIQQPPAK